MIRYLTERIPLLVSPRWILSRIQPIAIDDIIEYLVRAIDVPESAERVLEIGGPEVMTYADTLMRYAAARGLKRRLLPLPVLTPSLSSHWVGWVTPISARLARPLIEGVHNEVIVRDHSAEDLFPEIEPMGYDVAVQQALNELGPQSVNTDLIDGRAKVDRNGRSISVLRQEGLYVRRECTLARSSAETLYQTVASLGGERGWRRFNWVWRLRGLADRVVGGIGFRKGRRDPHSLRLDDTVDFLSVDRLEPHRLIRFKYDGRMPGRLWLQFEAAPHGGDTARFCLTVFVDTIGLIGLLYWYLTYPAHAVVFSGLHRDVLTLAEQHSASEKSSASV
jgi:hypothetical protein